MDGTNREVAKILVVDDLPSNRLALEAILEPLGQQVISVPSGKAALSTLLHHDVACILLDVQMPGMDGIETARLIKQRERTRHVPLLFITAFSRTEREIAAAYAHGAVDYIVKPFQPDVLRTKVAVFVDLHLQAKRLLRNGDLLRDRDRDVMAREADERLRPAIRAERAKIAQFERAFTAMVDRAPIGMGLIGADLHYEAINESLARVHGVSAEAARSVPLSRLAPRLSRVLLDAIEARDADGPITVHHELIAANGERRLLTVTLDPTVNDGPSGMVVDSTGVGRAERDATTWA